LTGLVKKMDQRLETGWKGTRTPGVYVIYLDNEDGLDGELRQLAEREGLKHVCLGIGVPPEEYQVAGEADVTVVFYSRTRRPDQKVTANFALRRGELDEAKTDAIVEALSAVLPK
jgi:hypothetical protein